MVEDDVELVEVFGKKSEVFNSRLAWLEKSCDEADKIVGENMAHCTSPE
jgi:hypothetical protein